MKKYLGPIFILISLSAHANSNNANLFLRAVVPLKTSIFIEMNEKGPLGKLVTNTDKYRAQAKFEIQKNHESYIVLVTHP